MLHILRPAKAPGFAYAWLELVSHRIFVGRVLAMTAQQRVSTVCSSADVVEWLARRIQIKSKTNFYSGFALEANRRHIIEEATNHSVRCHCFSILTSLWPRLMLVFRHG